MRTDALVSFLPVGAAAQSLVGAAGADIQIGNIFDILGLGVGVAPTNDIIGNATVFGSDVGIGGVKPQVEVVIGTACATADGATPNFKFEAAIDNGASQPGPWNVLVETGGIAVANLGAGAVCARFDFPPAFPPGLQPRFLRLVMNPGAGLVLTAGTVQNAIVTTVRDDQANKYAASNYKVS